MGMGRVWGLDEEEDKNENSSQYHREYKPKQPGFRIDAGATGHTAIDINHTHQVPKSHHQL